MPKRSWAIITDLALGILSYTAISWLFHKQFNAFAFMLTVCFAFFPDIIDIPLFIVLRKKLNLVSHHILHFPMWVLPATGCMVFFLTRSWYVTSLAVVATFLHFVHDSTNLVGIKWTSCPFDTNALKLEGLKIVPATARDEYYANLRRTKEKRGTIDEILMRIREEKPDKKSIFLLVATVTAFLVFLITKH